MYLCPYCLFFCSFLSAGPIAAKLAAVARELHQDECAALRRIREAGERQAP